MDNVQYPCIIIIFSIRERSWVSSCTVFLFLLFFLQYLHFLFLSSFFFLDLCLFLQFNVVTCLTFLLIALHSIYLESLVSFDCKSFESPNGIFFCCVWLPIVQQETSCDANSFLTLNGYLVGTLSLSLSLSSNFNSSIPLCFSFLQLISFNSLSFS